MDIPNYSIVNTTVEISKKYGSEKFVNAILRNIVKHKKKLITQTPITLNIPQWLKNNILRYFDNNTLKLIAEKIVTEPCTDIYVKSKLIKDNDWEKTLGGNFVFENVLRLKKMIKSKIFLIFLMGIGGFKVYRQLSQLKFLTKFIAKKLKKQISLLDVGSAPGAKTFQLLDSGYNVSSLEISKRRIVTLKKNSQRTKFKTSIINDDFTSYKHKSKFDSILIDAPCSGSGLIQKNLKYLFKKKILQNFYKNKN